MLTLLAAVIGPIVTAVLGNALLQRWQLRSWFAQQRQISHKEEFEQLQRLLDELSVRANARLFATRSFLRNLNSYDPALDKAKERYRQEVALWNETLNSLYVRLTLYFDYELTNRLEENVHRNFVQASVAVEQLAYRQYAGNALAAHDLARCETQLNNLQGAIWSLSRDLLRILIERREYVIEGRKVYYSRSNLSEFSTLTLVKLLFAPDVDGSYVIRPA